MKQLLRAAVITSLSACVLAEVQSEEAGPEDKQQSQWITSMTQLGSQDAFIASTANGLLMQPASVESFTAQDPKSRTVLYTHPAAVWAVVASPDGNLIASVDYRGNLGTYNVANSKATVHEKVLERWCQSLIMDPSGKSVVAGNEAGKIMVWNLEEGKIASSTELDGHAVTGLAISPDQQQLAASDGSGHVHLLEWPSLESIGKMKISDSPAWCIAFSLSGEQIFVGCADNHLYQIASQADSEPQVLMSGKDWITELSVSSSGEIAAGEVSGGIHVISDFQSPASITKSFRSKSGIWSLYWNGEEQLLVGSRKHGVARIGRSWDWIAEKTSEQEPAAVQNESSKTEPGTETEATETEAEIEAK
ncbi:MAG: WD40 repeat domain-containing protein [Planctomycetota bacterium]|nr:WD40 repeat domain-containing protein [Planctomycetota bacterium]